MNLFKTKNMILLATTLAGSCIFYYFYDRNKKLMYEKKRKKWIKKNTKNKNNTNTKSFLEKKLMDSTEYQKLLKIYMHGNKEKDVLSNTHQNTSSDTKAVDEDNPIIIMASI